MVRPKSAAQDARRVAWARAAAVEAADTRAAAALAVAHRRAGAAAVAAYKTGVEVRAPAGLAEAVRPKGVAGVWADARVADHLRDPQPPQTHQKAVVVEVEVVAPVLAISVRSS